MAGYSGGRKVIAPGIAGKETITTFHGARFMGHPCAVNCVLEGNPLHQEQLAIAAMVGRVLCANVVIDEARRLSFVNFGEVVASHRLAVEYVDGFQADIDAKRFADIDEWQTQMQLKPMRIGRVQVYAGMLSAADRALTGVGNLESVQAAIAESVRSTGDRSVAVIPEGPYVVPVYRPA